MSVDAASLDPKVLEQLRELERAGSPGFVAQLVDLFFKQTGEQVLVLKSSLATRDDSGLGRSAHLLKGSCGSLGALRMMEVCRRLEAAARGRSWSESETLVAEVEAEFARVRAALEVERAR